MKNRVRYEQNAAVLALLAATWPNCFSVFEQRRRPLKVLREAARLRREEAADAAVRAKVAERAP